MRADLLGFRIAHFGIVFNREGFDVNLKEMYVGTFGVLPTKALF